MIINSRLWLAAFLIIGIGVLLAGCGGSAPMEQVNKPPSAGEAIFAAKCRRCHIVDGLGGNKGPDLSEIGDMRDAKWLDKYLRDPKSVDLKNKMKAPTLTDKQRSDIIEYLGTRKSEQR